MRVNRASSRLPPRPHPLAILLGIETAARRIWFVRLQHLLLVKGFRVFVNQQREIVRLLPDLQISEAPSTRRPSIAQALLSADCRLLTADCFSTIRRIVAQHRLADDLDRRSALLQEPVVELLQVELEPSFCL